jgi:hypothetical protein
MLLVVPAVTFGEMYMSRLTTELYADVAVDVLYPSRGGAVQSFTHSYHIRLSQDNATRRATMHEC